MHGEVLLRQRCGLRQGDKNTPIFTPKHRRNEDDDGSVVVTGSLTDSHPGGLVLKQ